MRSLRDLFSTVMVVCVGFNILSYGCCSCVASLPAFVVLPAGLTCTIMALFGDMAGAFILSGHIFELIDTKA